MTVKALEELLVFIKRTAPTGWVGVLSQGQGLAGFGQCWGGA